MQPLGGSQVSILLVSVLSMDKWGRLHQEGYPALKSFAKLNKWIRQVNCCCDPQREELKEEEMEGLC